MKQASTYAFNIQVENAFTQNVSPILHEIRHSLTNLRKNGKTNIIDLRSMPLAPGEEQTLIDILGKGELIATLNALGPSEIYETQYAGVWLISHYDESSNIVARFIEITMVPDILKSQRQDIAYSLDRLTDSLAET